MLAAMCAIDIRLPFLDAVLAADAARRVWPRLLLATVAGVLLAALTVVVIRGRPRLRRRRRRSALRGPERLPWLRTGVFAVALSATIVFTWHSRSATGRTLAYLGGSLVVAATLPAVVGVLLTVVGRTGGGWGLRRGSAGALTGGRRLQRGPHRTARLALGLCFGILLVGQVQLWSSALGVQYYQALDTRARLGHRRHGGPHDLRACHGALRRGSAGERAARLDLVRRDSRRRLGSLDDDPRDGAVQHPGDARAAVRRRADLGPPTERPAVTARPRLLLGPGPGTRDRRRAAGPASPGEGGGLVRRRLADHRRAATGSAPTDGVRDGPRRAPAGDTRPGLGHRGPERPAGRPLDGAARVDRARCRRVGRHLRARRRRAGLGRGAHPARAALGSVPVGLRAHAVAHRGPAHVRRPAGRGGLSRPADRDIARHRRSRCPALRAVTGPGPHHVARRDGAGCVRIDLGGPAADPGLTAARRMS
ncbi:membrane hypothetical protein [Nostocoides japonicum T1-X7]|uniref:Uncharacterized protein n=1 Tax=Nostocoides japonicum T1-X7 TaxID=1194083 RepID=A0A077M3B5_9MICO|nr:membrane hypothetical protein [Tetrasphaera japonica T1-X7]